MNEMRIHRDFVLIVPHKEEMHGEIYLPEVVQEAKHASNREFIREYNRAALGRVVAVGPGYYDIEAEEQITPDLEPGMTVAYERAAAVAADWWDGEEDAVLVQSAAVYFEVMDDSLEPEIGGFRTKEKT